MAVYFTQRPTHSALGSGLSGIGQALMAAYTGYQGAKEQQRLERERERELAEKRFATDRAIADQRRQLAATLPEEQVAAMFPPTVEAPHPETGDLVEVRSPGQNLVLDAGEGAFRAEAPDVTPDIPIPEHLGGGTLPGSALISRDDVRAQELADARAKALAQRDIAVELGDVVEITPEHIQALPEGLRGMYSVGQKVPRSEIGQVQSSSWSALTRERGAQGRADAAARRQTKTINGRVMGWDPETQSYTRDLGSAVAPQTIDQEVTPEMEERVLRGTVGDWRDWREGMLIAEDASSRKDRRLIYKDLATQNDRVLPSKDTVKMVKAGKKTLADIEDAQELLDGSPEVQKALGAYEGRITDFVSGGWLDFIDNDLITPEVRQFRALINRLSAEERHRLYGAALTAVESKFAQAFLPAINQPLAQLQANLDEFGDDIERGLDAIWGVGNQEEARGAAAPNVNVDRQSFDDARARGNALLDRYK